MRRTRTSYLVVVTVILVMVAVSTARLARGSPTSDQLGVAASPSPVEPTGIANEWTQKALDFTYKHVTIKSGEPVVLLSRPISHQEYPSLGFQPWAYAPDCVRPMHLVVIKGDFDLNGAFPASVAPSAEIPASYVGYVYDLESGGGLAEIMSDRDGSTFKLVLGDPRLPDPDPSLASISTPAPPYMPCEDTVFDSDDGPTPVESGTAVPEATAAP